jgi:hypothetical protein
MAANQTAQKIVHDPQPQRLRVVVRPFSTPAA